MDSDPILILVLSLILSAFFSGIEIAFISANKLKIEVDKNKGGRISGFFADLIKKPARFITTMLMGNNIALVLFGLAASALLTPTLSMITTNGLFILLLTTLITTVVILVSAEFLPKVLFSKNPNGTLKIFAIPVLIVYYLLYPLVSFVNGLSNFILKFILRVDIDEQEINYGLIDLDHYLKELATGQFDEEGLENEIQILQNVLEFNSVKVRECMVPRNEIIAIEFHDSISELLSKFLNSGHSKIPVYRGTVDRIIGYIHSSDLFNHPKFIRQILRPISVVPETMPADDVMSTFIKKHQSMAVVVDEFGGTAGILTLEDVVEEIFGEIVDEHDKGDLTENKISENEYVFSSRLEIDYLNEEYDLELPKSENYETLAGLFIEHFESIPNLGDYIELEDFTLEITSVSNNKINVIKLIRKDEN